jgi:hypothetical protein
MKREKFAESRERILYAAAARKGGYGWFADRSAQSGAPSSMDQAATVWR